MINYNDPNSPWLPPGYDPYKGMSDEEREKAGCMQGIITVVFVIIMLIVMALFSSCTTTRYVPVVDHKTDTLIQVQHQRDSIYFADSIYVSDFMRGDTVWRTEYRWQTRYIERTQHDTTYISKRDSIPVPYEVTKEVPRKRSTVEWVLTVAGLLSLLAVFIYAVHKLKWFLPGIRE